MKYRKNSERLKSANFETAKIGDSLYLFSFISGTVVGGDPDKVMRVQYIWVFVRDQTELDPKAAWRLLEFGVMSANEQFL